MPLVRGPLALHMSAFDPVRTSSKWERPGAPAVIAKEAGVPE
jgi:hypothetical protein